MSNGFEEKSVTSGPSIETLTLAGKITKTASAGTNRLDLKVQLDSVEIQVFSVPKEKLQRGDSVKLKLEVGTVEVEES